MLRLSDPRTLIFAAAATLAWAPAIAAQGCARPAAPADTAATAWNAPLDRLITLHVHGVSLRDALDRSAAAAGVRLSYSADLLPLDRAECATFDRAPLGRVLASLLHDTGLGPVTPGGDLVVLARKTADSSTRPPVVPVPVLQRVVVTGSAIGAPQRSLTVALDVLSGKSLDERRASTLGDAFGSSVPGMWAWPQSPTNLLTSYGSIRGASSFGVSYPKIYIDGIEVANPLLVSTFSPEAVDHVEVIRGPQGSALYGSDAISGVVNILSLHQAPDSENGRFVLRSGFGESASDYATAAFTQQQSASLRTGSNTRSANFTLSGGSIGDFIPRGHSGDILAMANGRMIGARSIVTGIVRFFGENAGAPVSPVLLDARAAAARTGGSNSGPGSANDTPLAPLLVDQPNQTVREYTLGGTVSLMASDRWTHSFTAGVDGYRLHNVATDQTPIPTEADSALRAAQGGADRLTLRASSVARMGDEANGATFTFSAEQALLRQATAGPLPRRPASDGSGDSSGSGSQTLPAGATGPLFIDWESTSGLTAQASTAFHDALYVTGGLRAERDDGFTNTRQVALLPMLGAALVREHNGLTVKFRAAYGKGIRPATSTSHSLEWQAAERNDGSTSTASIPPLTPEEQSGIEAGVDLTWRDVIQVQATRFDQRATGLIQQVALAGDTSRHESRILFALENVGEISNSGWELQGTTRISQLTLGAALSTVDSHVIHLATGYTGDLAPGDRMLDVPALTASVRAGWHLDKWTLWGGASRASDWINYDRLALTRAYATDSRPARDLVGSALRAYWAHYDGVTQLRAMISRQLRGGLALEITGDNLLGYQTGEPDNVTVLPGRTFMTALRARF